MSAEGEEHQTWMPHNVRDETPVYDGTPPLPREDCDLCERSSPELCGYHGGAIFYCTRCGRFLVHRANLVPPDEPGGQPVAKGCHCPDIEVGSGFDTRRMHYIGYEATVDPRIKARTPGVRDPRDRVVTTCQFCAVEDLDDRNEGEYIVQLRARGGGGVASKPVCDECREAHGWCEDDVRELIV